MRALSVILIFWVSLLGNSRVFSDSVLCIGADGHFAIENQEGRQCGSWKEELPSARLQEGMQDGNHCGPCKDIYLGNAGLYSYQKMVSLTGGLRFQDCALERLEGLEHHPKFTLYPQTLLFYLEGERPQRWLHHSSLRSVLLLI